MCTEACATLKGLRSHASAPSIPDGGTLGPHWFENDNSRTVRINGERYWAVLQKFHNDLAQKVTVNQLSITWFMQAGAPPHAAGDTITFMRQLFRNCLVALGTAHDWVLITDAGISRPSRF